MARPGSFFDAFAGSGVVSCYFKRHAEWLVSNDLENDVGAVGRVRVGHDRRRVRVDQDDVVAFLAQGFAGLGARVVELARLADDDGAAPMSRIRFRSVRRGMRFRPFDDGCLLCAGLS